MQCSFERCCQCLSEYQSQSNRYRHQKCTALLTTRLAAAAAAAKGQRGAHAPVHFNNRGTHLFPKSLQLKCEHQNNVVYNHPICRWNRKTEYYIVDHWSFQKPILEKSQTFSKMLLIKMGITRAISNGK